MPHFFPRILLRRRFGWGVVSPMPDYPFQENHFGWRYWAWSPDRSILISHMYRTVWRDAELTAVNWKEHEECPEHRLKAGIHALNVPNHWWEHYQCDIEACGKRLSRQGKSSLFDLPDTVDWDTDEISITGIVERFGAFVRGEDGWRAERAVIRELLAPNTEIGLQLEKAFPDVHVRYMPTPIVIEPPPDPGDYMWC